ncbi:hypothetical protein LCGC14_2207710 [marine sediment metagenome]|uniref:PRTase-CE domain-containing protein n=1 Tax=marine sediment metagenome TaxID=412755 RepID=A0A0F9DEL7_9ZZZZ
MNRKDNVWLEFLMQFPPSLRISISKILSKIIFISLREMAENLAHLLDIVIDDFNKTNIVIFNNAWQKSSSAWSYFSNFFNDKKIRCISPKDVLNIIEKLGINDEYYFIFIDDVIGTGSQFLKLFNKEFQDQILKIKQIVKTNKKIYFYLIAGVGTTNSKELLSKNIDFLPRTNILYYYNLRESDKALHYDNFINKKDLVSITTFLKEKDPNWWNGYKDSQLLIILQWNTPNNTIGCLWHDTKNWKPLFPRAL